MVQVMLPWLCDPQVNGVCVEANQRGDADRADHKDCDELGVEDHEGTVWIGRTMVWWG